MGSVGLVFPGQGSQYGGMGRDLASTRSEARTVFEEADGILGWSVSEFCFDGPEDDLTRTSLTQPAVLVVSLAALAVLEAEQRRPSAVAGHSLGEYAALVAAGVLTRETVIEIVAERGAIMESCALNSPGSMVAVMGIPDEFLLEQVESARLGGCLQIANYNSPSQRVVSGEEHAVDALTRSLERAGKGRLVRLSVQGAFHSELMSEAGRQLERILAGVSFRDAEVPIFANVTGDRVSSDCDWQSLLSRQVTSPVLWESCVRAMARDGVDTFAEVGPGKVLSGLVRRTVRGVRTVNVEDSSSLAQTLEHWEEV